MVYTDRTGQYGMRSASLYLFLGTYILNKLYIYTMLRSNIVVCRVVQQSAQSTQATQLAFLTTPYEYDICLIVD